MLNDSIKKEFYERIYEHVKKVIYRMGYGLEAKWNFSLFIVLEINSFFFARPLYKALF
jgi:hypothetical protein